MPGYEQARQANGEMRTDAKGRRRPVKGRFKRCLLAALGNWPDTGRQEIPAWTLTEGEDLGRGVCHG